VSEKGLAQISDADQIASEARKVMAANPKQVEQYRSGKTATLGWLVGQVMKATRARPIPTGARGVEEGVGVKRTSPSSVVSCRR